MLKVLHIYLVLLVFSITANVWCYVQVCLVKTFNLAQNLMANLHIARVSSRFLFTNLI